MRGKNVDENKVEHLSNTGETNYSLNCCVADHCSSRALFNAVGASCATSNLMAKGGNKLRNHCFDVYLLCFNVAAFTL